MKSMYFRYLNLFLVGMLACGQLQIVHAYKGSSGINGSFYRVMLAHRLKRPVKVHGTSVSTTENAPGEDTVLQVVTPQQIIDYEVIIPQGPQIIDEVTVVETLPLPEIEPTLEAQPVPEIEIDKDTVVQPKAPSSTTTKKIVVATVVAVGLALFALVTKFSKRLPSGTRSLPNGPVGQYYNVSLNRLSIDSNSVAVTPPSSSSGSSNSSSTVSDPATSSNGNSSNLEGALTQPSSSTLPDPTIDSNSIADTPPSRSSSTQPSGNIQPVPADNLIAASPPSGSNGGSSSSSPVPALPTSPATSTNSSSSPATGPNVPVGNSSNQQVSSTGQQPASQPQNQAPVSNSVSAAPSSGNNSGSSSSSPVPVLPTSPATSTNSSSSPATGPNVPVENSSNQQVSSTGQQPASQPQNQAPVSNAVSAAPSSGNNSGSSSSSPVPVLPTSPAPSLGTSSSVVLANNSNHEITLADEVRRRIIVTAQHINNLPTPAANRSRISAITDDPIVAPYTSSQPYSPSQPSRESINVAVSDIASDISDEEVSPVELNQNNRLGLPLNSNFQLPRSPFNPQSSIGMLGFITNRENRVSPAAPAPILAQQNPLTVFPHQNRFHGHSSAFPATPLSRQGTTGFDATRLLHPLSLGLVRTMLRK